MTEDKSTVSYRSAEHRRKISEANQERARRLHEQGLDKLADWKRCSRCKKVKRLSLDGLSDFYIVKRVNKSGYVSLKPSPECKVCARARAKKVRDRKPEEQRRADRHRWNQNRDPDEVRVYNREYQRIRRVLQGAKPTGGLKKYRDQKDIDVRVLRAPFNEWLAQVSMSLDELSTATGLSKAFFIRRHKWVLLSSVDQVFTRLGMPDQTYVLYPQAAKRSDA